MGRKCVWLILYRLNLNWNRAESLEISEEFAYKMEDSFLTDEEEIEE